jgi:hypothetical protein
VEAAAHKWFHANGEGDAHQGAGEGTGRILRDGLGLELWIVVFEVGKVTLAGAVRVISGRGSGYVGGRLVGSEVRDSNDGEEGKHRAQEDAQGAPQPVEPDARRACLVAAGLEEVVLEEESAAYDVDQANEEEWCKRERGGSVKIV